MITSDLISYIKNQTKNNKPKNLIISELLEAGWHQEDIDEGFLSIEQASSSGAFSPVEKKELPKTETPKETKIENSKIWTPISIPTKEAPSVTAQKEEIKKIDEPIKTEQVKQTPEVKVLDTKEEELLPTLKPKVAPSSLPYLDKDSSTEQKEPVVSDSASRSSLIASLPKTAMLSSYPIDLASLTTVKEKKVAPEQKNNNKLFKWTIIVFIFFVLTIAVAVVSGYLDIKNLNFISIKKDPRVLLLSNSKTLSSLGSYKTETTVEISSPSFSNITNGLMSGESISSVDKDSVSINTLSMINKIDNNVIFDNFVTTKSSLLKDSITTDIKSNGINLFISSSDLGKIMNEKSSESSVVSIDENQINLILPLFPSNVEPILSKINIYKILSNGISSYINSKTFGIYDEFINKVEIVEKGQENIKNIDTYHYSIHFDRDLMKNLLGRVSDNFVLNLSAEEKSKLSEILGSVTVTSFDVWVGKGDNNIYQYSVVLDIPLSKIISYEDKSVGDNKVSVSWKTTYYDFNKTNNINIPEESVSVIDFINTVKQSRLKSDVNSFKMLAMNLNNTEGFYGIKSNLKGDCMEPIPGSLFSPIGHLAGTSTPIASISELMNKILKTTNGNGSCYSTPKAWSFTVPISNNYDPAFIPAGGYKSFYCIDSTGDVKELTALPTDVVCSSVPNVTKSTN